jgi:SAM-dependent methyltransferase
MSWVVMLKRAAREVPWLARIKRVVRAVFGAMSRDSATRVSRAGYFKSEQIGWVRDTYFKHGPAAGTAWDALRDSHMELPDWFQHGLDPHGDAYAEQQHRLWQLISGMDRPYEPDTDEKEHSWGDIDPVRTPGFYARRDAEAITAASDQVIATGMFLKHCGLKPGDWALEYGAGFGQTALALARLGVNVDTVDISQTFCEFVRRQAEFFQVPLTPFHGRFGTNPRPGKTYQLICFYESFHHCVDFKQVVHQLRAHLAPGGRILLGGEPIVDREYEAVPYPWGVRLHSEVAAVMREHHWFELGFSERFLNELFTMAGFVGRRIDCEPTLFGRLHVFEHRPDELHLGSLWLPGELAAQWHAAGNEADGRWTRQKSTLPLDTSDTFVAIEIDLANPGLRRRRIEVGYGSAKHAVVLNAGARRTLRIDAGVKQRELSFLCQPRMPGAVDVLRSGERRLRGIFVRRVRYVRAT